MGEETNLAEWGAGQIAGGAFSAVGSNLFGMALSGLGVGFPSSTDDSLGALKSQLAMIESQLVDLKNEVDEVIVRIGDAELNGRRQGLDSILDTISETSTNIKDAYTSGDFTTAKASITREDIKTAIQLRLVGQLSVIHDAAAGDGDDLSMYRLLAQNLKGAHRFLSFEDSTKVKRLIDRLQSAQFTQFWLVAQYYRANGDLQSMITDATNLYEANILEERKNFKSNRIWEGVAADQVTGLMIYYGDCPYVDYISAQNVISQMNANFAGDVQGWRLPTVAELLGNDDGKGIFSGYDKNDGTPAEWLHKHGVPKDMTGIHFWTSVQVPRPKESDFLKREQTRNAHIDKAAYHAAVVEWALGGPPHYVVDSANLSYFPVTFVSPAHVVAVRNPQPWERELLKAKEDIDGWG